LLPFSEFKNIPLGLDRIEIEGSILLQDGIFLTKIVRLDVAIGHTWRHGINALLKGN
jgi:hypothetical protein